MESTQPEHQIYQVDVSARPRPRESSKSRTPKVYLSTSDDDLSTSEINFPTPDDMCSTEGQQKIPPGSESVPR
eukprot:15449002-Alexandrium_andersonii.AAC.1